MNAVTIDRQDPRFEALKRGNNLRFPATDAEAAGRILICSNAEECSSALQRVVSSGLRPTVRSGGHCYEDFVSNNPNGAILDLSLHNRVEADSVGGPFCIAPGAALGDVYQFLYKRCGVSIPAGTCPRVGAGGHISGGGYGLLSRLNGLTVDWVTGMDILTVEASGKVVARRINKQHDPDLLRACRGAGGGNFGIITSFHFDQLPPAPREVAQASLAIPWSTMTEESFGRLLRLYGEYWEGRGQDHDTWGLSVVMTVGPRTSPNGRIKIDAQFCNLDGSVSDLSVLHEFFQRFDGVDSASATRSQPRTSNQAPGGETAHAAARSVQTHYQVSRQPWIEAALSEDVDPPTRAKYKSTYMKQNFTAAECNALYKGLASPAAHGFVLAIDGYGGAINNPDRAHDTAIAQRSSTMKLQWQCYWQEKDQDAVHIKYMDDLYTAVYTGSHVSSGYQGTPFGPRYEGCYMNYADADMLRYRFWPQLFFGSGDLYRFLQKVKQRYDPNNIFHSSMSVRA